MFHFPTFPPHTLCVQVWVTGHDSCRVSPFGNPRIKARSAAPRGLSQPPTSFIGSWCQGIHRAPLLTCAKTLKKDARVHCAVLKVRATLPSTSSRASNTTSFDARLCRTKDRPNQDGPEGVINPLPQDSTACLRISWRRSGLPRASGYPLEQY